VYAYAIELFNPSHIELYSEKWAPLFVFTHGYVEVISVDLIKIRGRNVVSSIVFKTGIMDVGFGVVTAVVMKSTTFWDIRP
jgi:hypothetical protein